VLRREWRALTAAARERLREVYASALPESDKLREKAATFAALRAGYDRLTAQWGSLPGYERWFANGANNAGLAAGALYADRVAVFQALLAAEEGDLPRFYARVRTLAAMPRADRDAALAALDGGGGRSENVGAAADRALRQ
jgi:predicted aminopeptidase